MRKFALTCDPLVRLSCVLDSILKLTGAVRKLFDYDVAAADCSAVYDVCCQRDSLTFTKLMIRHHTALRFSAFVLRFLAEVRLKMRDASC